MGYPMIIASDATSCAKGFVADKAVTINNYPFISNENYGCKYDFCLRTIQVGSQGKTSASVISAENNEIKGLLYGTDVSSALSLMILVKTVSEKPSEDNTEDYISLGVQNACEIIKVMNELGLPIDMTLWIDTSSQNDNDSKWLVKKNDTDTDPGGYSLYLKSLATYLNNAGYSVARYNSSQGGSGTSDAIVSVASFAYGSGDGNGDNSQKPPTIVTLGENSNGCKMRWACAG